MNNHQVHALGLATVARLLAAHDIPAEPVQGGFQTPRGRIRVLAATGTRRDIAWRFDVRKLGNSDLVVLVSIIDSKPRAFVGVATAVFSAFIEREQAKYLARETGTKAPDYVVVRAVDLPDAWPLFLTWLSAKE